MPTGQRRHCSIPTLGACQPGSHGTQLGVAGLALADPSGHGVQYAERMSLYEPAGQGEQKWDALPL